MMFTSDQEELPRRQASPASARQSGIVSWLLTNRQLSCYHQSSSTTPNHGNHTMKRVHPRANAKHILGMLALASAADIESGVSWYQRAYDLSVRLIHTYDGLRLAQAIGVIAALSPNNKWERNCMDAEAMIKLWHQGIDPRLAKVCTYNTNKDKAACILELESVDTETIQEILSGQKVVAFYRCISGFQDTVCVDGHAFAIFMGERITTTQTPSIGKALCAAITRSYILASERSIKTCGVKLTPYQVQAVTWVTYRRLLGYDN